MTITQKAILRTLLYFDIFSHPLNKSELYSLIGTSPGREEFEASLTDLISMNLVANESGHYFLIDGTSSIKERMNKLNRSMRYHRIARIVSALIYCHPFVKGVLVSGSLSKSAFSKKDDIDYFIIAEPGRVWLCKALLMIFKKVFMLNSRKYFCLNYFIGSNSLEIDDKNIFTATEIAYLIPLRNSELCGKFFLANDWISEFFPNLTIDLAGCSKGLSPFPKKIAEYLLKGVAGDRLDSWFMDLYRKRSRKKFWATDPDLFSINFKSEKNVSKYHPNGFQNIVTQLFGTKINEYQSVHHTDLTL